MVKYCNYNLTLKQIKRNINASFSLINLDQFQLNHITRMLLNRIIGWISLCVCYICIWAEGVEKKEREEGREGTGNWKCKRYQEPVTRVEKLIFF